MGFSGFPFFSSPRLIPDKIIYNQFQKALIHAANDYTTDRNGDYTNKFL